MIDSVPASAIASAGSSAASGTIAARMSGASAESGPITSTRDGPTSAYTSSGTIVA